ncbi:MAG: hypothetical protein IJW64_05395 [Clostridia bacterium]|nr:hypothetical protein [Clostridia bacterium]
MISEDRKNRIKELESRSQTRRIFVFSDFLSPSSIADATDMLKKGSLTVFGGADFTERKMIRFGNADELGYDEPFPIAVLKITLTGGKFATPISHRDVLGAVTALGIERQKLGDMFVIEGFAYVLADKTVAKLILSDLRSIGRNNVLVEEVSYLPKDLAPKTETLRFSVSSNRADGIICKVFNLSREDSKTLFQKELVLINGKAISNPSRQLKESETVAVRGFGKFIFVKEDGLSKKNKPYVEIELFV